MVDVQLPNTVNGLTRPFIIEIYLQIQLLGI